MGRRGEDWGREERGGGRREKIGERRWVWGKRGKRGGLRGGNEEIKGDKTGGRRERGRRKGERGEGHCLAQPFPLLFPTPLPAAHSAEEVVASCMGLTANRAALFRVDRPSLSRRYDLDAHRGERSRSRPRTRPSRNGRR